MNEYIKLGTNVIDKVTGFKGILTARCKYLHSSNRCLVSPKVGDHNKMEKNYWIYEDQLVEMK